MKILISGGCKNGKSYFAQKVAKYQNSENLFYIATMNPSDHEDFERVKKHRKDRAGWGFKTIERHVDIWDCIQNIDNDASFLLDSLTALLANEMFRENEIRLDAGDKICDELKAICSKAKNIVFVSDYIYSDAYIYDEVTENYRKSLAKIDRNAALLCDVVIEVVYGNLIFHKGKDEMCQWF